MGNVNLFLRGLYNNMHKYEVIPFLNTVLFIMNSDNYIYVTFSRHSYLVNQNNLYMHRLITWALQDSTYLVPLF